MLLFNSRLNYMAVSVKNLYLPGRVHKVPETCRSSIRLFMPSVLLLLSYSSRHATSYYSSSENGFQVQITSLTPF